MLSLISLLRRKEGLSHEEFLARWTANNTRLFAPRGACLRYTQCPIDEEPVALAGMSMIDVHLDGFDKIEFTSTAAFTAFVQSPEAAALWAAHAQFVGAMALYAVEETEIRNELETFPTPLPEMLKRIVLVKRQPSLTTEQYLHHWREVHAPMARRVPHGARLYLQLAVLGELENPPGVPSLALGLDGFSETWYDDAAQLARGAATPEGQAVGRDNLTFCAQSKRFFFREQI